ncbi:hypothetical protein [Agrococcus casei]|uniref:hypothetical protein n=1 Tax=Agrococcus casei TaxID=343512 RepID=UPI003F8EBBC6
MTNGAWSGPPERHAQAHQPPQLPPPMVPVAVPQQATIDGYYSSRAEGMQQLVFPTTMSRDGRIAWVFGLLSVLGLPFLSLVAPGVTMTVLGLLQRRKNPVAAVGRNVALFGAINVAVCAIFLIVLAGSSAVYEGGVTLDNNPLLLILFAFPVGAYIVAIGPILNIVLAIVALVRPVSPARAAKILAGRNSS